MNIRTNGEFGYEMVVVVPYAYWLHINNQLTSTTSCKDTQPLYYFSNKHNELFDKRSPCLGTDVDINGASFKNLHTAQPNFSKWKFPDYKAQFKNNIFTFDKPLLILSNKRYSRGSTQRHGWFDDSQLELLFKKFHNKYQIIYNRAKSNKITVDTQLPKDVDTDYALCEAYGVIDINNLHDKYADTYSFNTLQFMLHANCDKFISVQGGSSILSSAFGGTNLIYALSGEELKVGSYANWYSKFSECNVAHASDFEAFESLTNSFLND